MTNLECLKRMLYKAQRNLEVNQHRKPNMPAGEYIALQQKVSALTEAVQAVQERCESQ